MKPPIEFTVQLVALLLRGQVDKSGMSMFSHATRVCDRLVDPTEDEQHAALLHDVIEDTEFTLTSLKVLGYSQAVIDMVELLTHDTNRLNYVQYIQRIRDSGNAGAIKIKLADNADNSDPRRHVALEPVVSAGLQQRYAKAREILHAE